MTKNKKIVISALPFVALIALFAIFCGIVSSKGYRLDMYIKIIFNEGIVLSIVATGAIFIYTLGSFDISLGAATLFAATLGVVSYNKTENLGVMMSVLSAIASQIITTKGGAVGGISIPSAVVKPMDTSVFKIIVLVIWVAVCIFIFNYTKFGRREKFVGGNPVCSELSGIKYNKYAILGFLIAGIGVGIGAFMTLVYTPSVTTTTAGDIGMNIMVAIVFGGMPISGGARSKIYAAVVGGFSYIILNNILDLLIDSTSGYGITQIISAVFFLIVVYVASVNYRSQMLPR